MRKNNKKSEIIKKRFTVISLLLVIVMSWTVIVLKARASMTASARNPLLINAPGIVTGKAADGPLSVPPGCCGTASKTYSCDANSFGTDTFCGANGRRSAFPKVINFPKLGETVKWSCVCRTPGGGPVVGLNGQPLVSSCSAKRDNPACAANNMKTIVVDKEKYKSLFCGSNGKLLPSLFSGYANDNLSHLCTSGYMLIKGLGHNPDSEVSDKSTWGCIIIGYQCRCDKPAPNTGKSGSDCLVRYCYGDFYEQAGAMRARCGDGILDASFGEECEKMVTMKTFKITFGGLFGHSCADKGLCGTAKCSSTCKLDYSGCYPCPPTSGGILVD